MLRLRLLALPLFLSVIALAACGAVPAHHLPSYTVSPSRPNARLAVLLAACLHKVDLQVSPAGTVPSRTTITLTATVALKSPCPGPSYQFEVVTNNTTAVIQPWSPSAVSHYQTGIATSTLNFIVQVGAPSIPLTQVTSPSVTVQAPPPTPVPTSHSTPPPSSPKPTPPPMPTTFMVSNVPHLYQTNTSEYCEAASLAMALHHEGIDVSISTVIAHENVQYPTQVYSEYEQEVSNGDPYTSFVGNPYGTGTTPSSYGYGTYYPNLARDAGSLGGQVLWSGTGLGLTSLYQDLASNHPVVAWVDDNNSCVLQNSGGLFYVTAADGARVPYPRYGNEHALVVAGVSPGSVYILNPLPCGYSGWISKSAFANTFASFANMAVVLN